MWYLRASIIEAQDLRLAAPASVHDVRIKIRPGFQSSRTWRPNSMNRSSCSFTWMEDLMFVVSEPLTNKEMLVMMEDRTTKEAALLGYTGGYYVLDEAAHACVQRLPVDGEAVLEVSSRRAGIRHYRGPWSTPDGDGGGKGSTDVYCVAKYGKKWMRTWTVLDSFDPRWNEQYT
ncbi:hypothetical protein ZIOFF_057374 [Zingiber officinale]|uniref:C2 domain-containing protein n=1 Tax=Zingiber officinale TaxID=94328 RepID=A0A8J5F383_ZINOF|nr:hypothetical protein ZIOFF_057374 [Zingiber officinale]